MNDLSLRHRRRNPQRLDIAGFGHTRTSIEMIAVPKPHKDKLLRREEQCPPLRASTSIIRHSAGLGESLDCRSAQLPRCEAADIGTSRVLPNPDKLYDRSRTGCTKPESKLQAQNSIDCAIVEVSLEPGWLTGSSSGLPKGGTPGIVADYVCVVLI